MSFISKMILLELSLVLSLPAAAKTQCLVHLRFHSTFQLINGISSHLQKLLKYFNGTTIFIIPLALFGGV